MADAPTLTTTGNASVVFTRKNSIDSECVPPTRVDTPSISSSSPK